MSDLTEPASIVFALARCQEPVDSEACYCLLCEEDAAVVGGTGHTPECPWLRACRWLEAMNNAD
jgi:hypothetical protein